MSDMLIDPSLVSQGSQGSFAAGPSESTHPQGQEEPCAGESVPTPPCIPLLSQALDASEAVERYMLFSRVKSMLPIVPHDLGRMGREMFSFHLFDHPALLALGDVVAEGSKIFISAPALRLIYLLEIQMDQAARDARLSDASGEDLSELSELSELSVVARAPDPKPTPKLAGSGLAESKVARSAPGDPAWRPWPRAAICLPLAGVALACAMLVGMEMDDPMAAARAMMREEDAGGPQVAKALLSLRVRALLPGALAAALPGLGEKDLGEPVRADDFSDLLDVLADHVCGSDVLSKEMASAGARSNLFVVSHSVFAWHAEMDPSQVYRASCLAREARMEAKGLAAHIGEDLMLVQSKGRPRM